MRSIGGGAARVEVEIQGPARTPPSPSPREPGYTTWLQTKEEGFSGSLLLKLFHRPELSPRGVRAFLDRAVQVNEGSVRDLTVVFAGKTCAAKELTLEIEDPLLVRGRYRIVVVDEVPVCGIYEADLEEVWASDAPDGELHEERRHDQLTLVEWKQ